MANYFGKPFASSGTRTTIPSDQQTDGAMSFIEGWGADYERNPLTDEKARRIERAKMNYLFYIITEAIGEIQRLGSSTWDESKMPYDEGASCYHGGGTWVSIIANNKDKPGITKNWVKVGESGGSSGGDGFDPTKYYTKTEINTITQQINTSMIAISLHENGDIYPVARHALITNEYICNGDTIPVLSTAGILLKALPDSYKTSWGIKQIGTQRIKLPMIITKEDIESYFSTAVFSPSPGFNRDELYYYEADNKELPSSPGATVPTIHHFVARFIPVLWLNAGNEPTNDNLQIFFEGTDNIGVGSNGEIKIQQLRFGLYHGGVRYVTDEENLVATVNTLIFRNKTGSQISGGNVVTNVSSTELGVVITLTLAQAITVSNMTAILSIAVPNFNGETVPRNVSISLTNEALI